MACIRSCCQGEPAGEFWCYPADPVLETPIGLFLDGQAGIQTPLYVSAGHHIVAFSDGTAVEDPVQSGVFYLTGGTTTPASFSLPAAYANSPNAKLSKIKGDGDDNLLLGFQFEDNSEPQRRVFFWDAPGVPSVEWDLYAAYQTPAATAGGTVSRAPLTFDAPQPIARSLGRIFFGGLFWERKQVVFTLTTVKVWDVGTVGFGGALYSSIAGDNPTTWFSRGVGHVGPDAAYHLYSGPSQVQLEVRDSASATLISSINLGNLDLTRQAEDVVALASGGGFIVWGEDEVRRYAGGGALQWVRTYQDFARGGIPAIHSVANLSHDTLGVAVFEFGMPGHVYYLDHDGLITGGRDTDIAGSDYTRSLTARFGDPALTPAPAAAPAAAVFVAPVAQAPASSGPTKTSTPTVLKTFKSKLPLR